MIIFVVPRNLVVEDLAEVFQKPGIIEDAKAYRKSINT